jgi:hypothetical protein
MKKIKNLAIKILIVPPLIMLMVLFSILALFGNKTIMNYYNLLFGEGRSDSELNEEINRLIFLLENAAIIFWMFVLYIIVFSY